MLPRKGYPEYPHDRSTYSHVFVDLLPEKLDDGILYVSMRYATAAHNCFCGCSREVVTPLHPTKWRMGFDGVNVSLSPSIGNWSLPCQSHYCLQGGKIIWAETLSQDEIEAVRAGDLAAQALYWDETPRTPAVTTAPSPKRSVWRNLWRRKRKK